ncbi:MAG: glycosyltransferase [Candidatus Sedimenticola sp. (ex Thyasira tokunagai)]
MKNDIRPIIFWEGFPACGLLLKQVLNEFPETIVLATRPAVPFHDLENLLGHDVHWLDNADDIWNLRGRYSDKNFVIHTGWNHAGWLRYDRYVKNKNDAKIVVVVDNSFKANFRQFIGAFYFRLWLKKYFCAAFVPGREGQRLLKYLGLSSHQIYVGNYGAYEGIYRDTRPIVERNNEFLFVGQLNRRKSVDVLVNGFRRYREQGGTWNLRVLGDGPLRDMCNEDGLIFEGFTQPHLVADKMNNAKVLVLISREDHWGTVVCEAAACGMHLITSQSVGSSIDFIRNAINGIELPKIEQESLIEAFNFYDGMTDLMLKNGSDVSKGIARGYDSYAYYSAINKMINDLMD